jgi:hypothetical protein
MTLRDIDSAHILRANWKCIDTDGDFLSDNFVPALKSNPHSVDSDGYGIDDYSDYFVSEEFVADIMIPARATMMGSQTTKKTSTVQIHP